MKNIWRLLRLLPGFSWRVTKVGSINILLGAIVALTPFLLKLLVDRVIAIVTTGTGDTGQIGTFLAIIIALRLFHAVVEYLQERTSDMFFLDTTVDLRQKVFNHLLRLSIDFYEENRVGEIIQKVNSGVLDLARWVSRVFEGMLETLISLIFALILLWIIIPPVGLVMSIAFPLNLFLARYIAHKVLPYRRQWLKNNEQASGELTETLTHISTVRSFASEDYKSKRYAGFSQLFRSSRITQFRHIWSFNFLLNVINTVAMGSSLFLVTYGAIHGTNSAGDIFLVALYIQRLISNIVPLSRLISDTAEVEVTCERLGEILDSTQILPDKDGAIDLKNLETVEFKNVSFSYPGKKKEILHDVSFRLGQNQTLALVGPSGVGKTTIAKLLLRFYAPTSGQILVNNQPVEDFTQQSIRRLLGVVMQDVALFNDTIEENIQFARPEATKKEMEAAAAVAHADVFIGKLPDKYQTLVGERGIKLSGGEKQRVAIARAVLKNPQLIILDEATSALDSQSEKYVQDGLRTLLKDRTAVIIAHRLSTVMRADTIVVLQDGGVLEQGSHQELIAKKGLYAKLFSLQSDSLKDFDLTSEQAALLT